MCYPVVPCVEKVLNYLPVDNILSMQRIEGHATRGHTLSGVMITGLCCPKLWVIIVEYCIVIMEGSFKIN
jgi:hypothetical protein